VVVVHRDDDRAPRVYTFPEEVDFGTLSLRDLARDPGLLPAATQTLMAYQFGGAGFVARAQVDVPQFAITSERGAQGDRYQYAVKVVPGRQEAGAIRAPFSSRPTTRSFPDSSCRSRVTIVP